MIFIKGIIFFKHDWIKTICGKCFRDRLPAPKIDLY